jgi:hypothetical protein
VVQFPAGGKIFFSSPKHADWFWGPFSLITGTRGSFLGLSWLVNETDDSTLSSAEVKNEWRRTSTPSYAFMAGAGTALLYLYDWEHFVVNVIVGVT